MTTNDQAAYEPLAARGIGAERFDEPALFYLTHQALIDEWYALRKTVSAALNDWLETTVREAVTDLAGQHELEATRVLGPQKHVHLLLYPRDMPVIDSRPVVGVGLGWPRDSLNPVSNPLFACVRRSARPGGLAGAAALLDAGGRDFRSQKSGKGGDESTWPIYSYVPAHPRWWTDLDAYLADIAAGVETYVKGLRPALIAASSAAQEAAREAGWTPTADEGFGIHG